MNGAGGRAALFAVAVALVASRAQVASAHPAQFGTVHVRERGQGRHVVRFEYSGDESSPRGASLVWPAGCAIEGRVERVDRPFGEAQRMVVRCEPDGLSRPVRIEALPVGVQVAVRIEAEDGARRELLLDAGTPSFALAGSDEPGHGTFPRAVALGVEHIALGLDHLLFVAVLVLVHRRRGGPGLGLDRPALLRLLGTLTAFTVGHSLTLALAALDLVRLPAAPVETCIALSVLLVAAEVARAERGGAAETLVFTRPWLLAGLFGLVHGLGFAGALRETGLTQGSLAPVLVGFNVGVELGQIAFVAVLLAGLAMVMRLRAATRAPLAISYVAGALAAAWTFERALTLSVLGVLVVALSTGSAGCLAVPEVVPRTAEITMGTEDLADPAVAALAPIEARDRARCTATLVAPRVLLTAAHCEIDAAPEAWEAFFGSSLTGVGTRVQVLFALSHPEFDGGADHDLALVLLAEPAPVAPVALASGPPSSPPSPARLVGFGFTSAEGDDADRKREGTTSIDAVLPLHVVLAAAPSLPCSGDSGGPLFVGVPGAEVLAGVVSRGDPGCASLARATRVDAHLADFLVSTIEAWAEGSRAEGERCLYDAQCERGACLEALDEPRVHYCGGPCGDGEVCDSPLRCEAASCRLATPSPGALGAPCASTEDCARGECVASEGRCRLRCTPSRDECPAASVCTHAGSIDFFCLPVAPPPSCACRAAGRSSVTPRIVGLVLFALGLRWRRRRRDVRRSGPGLGQRET